MKINVKKGVSIVAAIGAILTAISEILKQYDWILEEDGKVKGVPGEELKLNHKTNDYNLGSQDKEAS